MAKIKWDLEKDKFPGYVKTIIICNNCGWLIYNPRITDIKGEQSLDTHCCNCGKAYTKTQVERI